MSDSHPSKDDLVSSLRAAHALEYRGYTHDLCGKAADEIERLREEVGSLSADVDHSIENGKKLRAEMARLTASERYAWTNTRLLDGERMRFRDALERIANQSAQDYTDPEQEAYASRRIASEALSK